MLLTEELSDSLAEFHNTIIYEVKNRIHPSLKHNHVPVRFLVDSCEYCRKYGNCFNQQPQDIQEP